MSLGRKNAVGKGLTKEDIGRPGWCGSASCPKRRSRGMHSKVPPHVTKAALSKVYAVVERKQRVSTRSQVLEIWFDGDDSKASGVVRSDRFHPPTSIVVMYE
jgi:hypothetical protein